MHLDDKVANQPINVRVFGLHLQKQLKQIFFFFLDFFFFTLIFSRPDKTSATCSSFLLWLPPLPLIGPQVARLAEHQSDGTYFGPEVGPIALPCKVVKTKLEPSCVTCLG